MKQLICKECGGEREIGRKLCRPCNLKRQRVAAAGRPRYMYELTCKACNQLYIAGRKSQHLCGNCHKDMLQSNSLRQSTNTYSWRITGKKHEHRAIAEQLMGRLLNTNEVVHHLDSNPLNNSVNNLMVMDRRSHGKLHLFLDLQRVILEKSGIENIENCWNTLIVPMTTAWLETTSAKVIKIWEIGQSAAEPLLNGEGSETMHDASVTSNVVEEDIVQTTTALAG